MRFSQPPAKPPAGTYTPHEHMMAVHPAYHQTDCMREPSCNSTIASTSSNTVSGVAACIHMSRAFPASPCTATAERTLLHHAHVMSMSSPKLRRHKPWRACSTR